MSISDLFAREMIEQDYQDMTPTYIISSYSIGKKIAHCCFSIDKIKTTSCKAVFGCITGNILNFFWPNGRNLPIFCCLLTFTYLYLFALESYRPSHLRAAILKVENVQLAQRVLLGGSIKGKYLT